MSYIYRCSRCDLRNTFRRAVLSYVKPKRCRHCGQLAKFRPDTERINRKACHCDGYHHPHRRGSRLCEHNPKHALHRAMQRGESDEVLMEISADLAWENEGGKVGGECPF